MNQNNIAAKREQEKRIVSLMIRTYCRGAPRHKAGALPGMSGPAGVRAAARRPLPVYRNKDLLLQLPGALL